LTKRRLRDGSWNGVTVATVLLTGAHHRPRFHLCQRDLRPVGLGDLGEDDLDRGCDRDGDQGADHPEQGAEQRHRDDDEEGGELAAARGPSSRSPSGRHVHTPNDDPRAGLPHLPVGISPG